MEARHGRSGWEMAAIAGLAATALGPILAMVLDRAFAVPGLFFVVSPVVLAGLVWTRNRGFMALVLVVSLLLFVAAIRSPFVQARLVNPNTGYFIVAWLQTLGPLAAVVGCFAALLRNRSAQQPRAA